jgi:hypothetical protein
MSISHSLEFTHTAANATTTQERRACHSALRSVGVQVHAVRSVEEARAALVKDAVWSQSGQMK